MSYFIIYEDKASEWRWKMRADNHENIAASEGYTTKENCLKTIRLIKREAATSPIWDGSEKPAKKIEG